MIFSYGYFDHMTVAEKTIVIEIGSWHYYDNIAGDSVVSKIFPTNHLPSPQCLKSRNYA